jgi:hypothetical protein
MDVLFHQAGVGDFVLTLPILRAMVDPVVVASWSKAALAQRMVPRVRPVDIEMFEFTRLHAEDGPRSLSPAVREVFEQATRIVSFVSRGDDAWAANVRRLAPRATLACLATRPPADHADHVTAYHQQQLAAQGIAGIAATASPATLSPDAPVMIHPGSGGQDKCWPAQRFEQLIAKLTARGRSVKVILGEAELERWPAKTIKRWSDAYDLAVVLDLPALHELLGGTSQYVGNDAGPTHLAAQMGLPTLALFGPTDPRVWSPVGPAVTVLAPPTPRAMDWLSVAAVLDALASGG